MLEVVGAQIPVFQGGVGHYIIIKLLNLQSDALLLQDGLHLAQNVGVGGRGSAHLDVGVGEVFAAAAAGGQAGGQRQGAGDRNKLFHRDRSSLDWIQSGQKPGKDKFQRLRLSARRAIRPKTLWMMQTRTISSRMVAYITSFW